jgi:hypothetical protein
MTQNLNESEMYSLAQVNVGRLLAPLDDPLMAGYVALRPTVDSLARRSRGFIWRRTGPGSTSKETDLYDDPMIIANVSVWAGLTEFADFVYRSQHLEVLKRGAEWFDPLDGPHYALWWVRRGHLPSAEEARERMEHLRRHGETPHAFSLTTTFPAPVGGEAASAPDDPLRECAGGS